MSDLDDFKATYFVECSELLLDLEEQFAAIEGGDRSADRLNAVFRAIHSIKGGAGAFGFSDLVGFAHAYETLLDHTRNGKIELSDSVCALCIRANDIVTDFVNAARDGVPLSDDHGVEERARFDALTSDGAGDGGPPVEEFDIDFVPVVVDLFAGGAEPAPPAAEVLPAAPPGVIPRPAPRAQATAAQLDQFDEAPFAPAQGHWEIHFKPHSELYARANDPLLLFRELATLGQLTVVALVSEMPLGEFEAFGVYCAWQLTLVAPDVGEEQIREVFEFVDGICDLSIAPLAASPMPQPAELAPPEPEVAVVDLFPASPTIEASAPSPAEPVPPVEEEALSFAELADTVQQEMPPRAVQKAEAAPKPAGPPAASSEGGGATPVVQSIRVDLDKVDRVVNMVGELVITQSMLTQQMDDSLRARYAELVRGLEVLAQTTRGLQDAVMAIRAQPVKSVFSRMPRLVRELAQKTEKKIKIEMIGEATEIDKTVIEQLSDPLTHMIRNSADHGIELPEVRIGRGKSEVGTIRLSAEQAGGNILIAVEDDGGGINRERVLSLAREKGIVPVDITPTDEQIDQLIFAPGFSTATEISDISGRGVGMDVVLSNIKKIGGSVHVQSRWGQGTRMTLRLPLTLAVLDVMLVKVGPSPYVVPLSSIVETIQCSRAEFGTAPSGGNVLRVRGEYVQVVDVAARFDVRTSTAFADRFVVLCESEGAKKVALLVDDIIGQQQVVIKSLEENFQSVEGIAGGTILGDGNVALIVDVPGLAVVPTHHKNAA